MTRTPWRYRKAGPLRRIHLNRTKRAQRRGVVRLWLTGPRVPIHEPPPPPPSWAYFMGAHLIMEPIIPVAEIRRRMAGYRVLGIG